MSAVTAVWVRKYEELVKERAHLEQSLTVSQQVAHLFVSCECSTQSYNNLYYINWSVAVWSLIGWL